MNRSCLEKFLVVASLIACIGWRVPAQAQDKPLRKISWGVTSLSASNWIPWIAKEAKIYEKNGLDVAKHRWQFSAAASSQRRLRFRKS
ncbi:MAG TPA: hypothetical protein VFX54_05185 [Candidatus Binatia bacterium]|nr:hypothetical protein [Candidatus Binatia bacterium]